MSDTDKTKMKLKSSVPLVTLCLKYLFPELLFKDRQADLSHLYLISISDFFLLEEEGG